MPYCQKLNSQKRLKLWDLIKVFVDKKNFEGCAGLVITNEMRLTIAAQACLLLLNLHQNTLYEEFRQYYGQDPATRFS